MSDSEHLTFLVLDHLDHPALQSLWEGQRDYHGQLPSPFAVWVGARQFAVRREELLEKSRLGRLRVDLAQETATGAFIGYAICTVTAQGVGEIDSLFVDEAHRGQGVGDQLMRRVLSWMDELNVRVRLVYVAGGNEVVLPFYARYGFATRSYVLKHVSAAKEATS